MSSPTARPTFGDARYPARPSAREPAAAGQWIALNSLAKAAMIALAIRHSLQGAQRDPYPWKGLDFSPCLRRRRPDQAVTNSGAQQS